MKRRPRPSALLAVLAIVLSGLSIIPPTASATPGVPDHLAFTTMPPGSATADDTINVEVTVQDTDDAAVPGNTDSIELTLNTGDIDSGGDPAVASDGVAIFALEIHSPGTYTLAAHDATSLLDVESAEFTIDPGAPTTLAWVTAPLGSVQSTDQIGATVAAKDQYGNPVPGETIE